MTDLSRLKVSLTKHNSHKIARLLKDYRTGGAYLCQLAALLDPCMPWVKFSRQSGSRFS